MTHIISQSFNYFLESNLLWGVRPLSSSDYVWEITDPYMKIIFYSYLSPYNGIVEDFLYGKPKPDIWRTLPTVKLFDQIEAPLPHLLYRNPEMPPFNNESLVLIFVGWDVYNYSRTSSARRALRRLIEPYLSKIRDDYLNLFIIDVSRGVEEAIGEILSGLVLRSLGFIVDVTSNPGHGVYLPTMVSRKYPDIIAWRTEETRMLQEEGIVKCGVFLPELSVIGLYGPPPCQGAKLNLDTELPDLNELIVVGEVEPSEQRIPGGIKQVETYDELGYSDITILISPGACRRTTGISCIDLQPPVKARLQPSNNVRQDRKSLLRIY